MIGKIIKVSDFDDKLFVTELEKNYTTKKTKINTLKKDFNDYILDLYNKILILNKYRKINQNVISFGHAFNISTKKNIDIPFYIPEKFEIKSIKIFFECNKFQFNKIKTNPINININTSIKNEFLFTSETFLKKNSTDFLYLSKESLNGTLKPSGAGGGQSFGVNQFDFMTSSFDYQIKKENGSISDKTNIEYEMQYSMEDYGEIRISTPNFYHQHKYPFASLKHKHYLQPTAHFHYYQIQPHNHNYPVHKHFFSVPIHEHQLDFSHSHDVENEFYQSSTIGNITIKINNNLIVDKKISGEKEFSQFAKNGINILNFNCMDKVFLIFTVTAQGRIKI